MFSILKILFTCNFPLVEIENKKKFFLYLEYERKVVIVNKTETTLENLYAGRDYNISIGVLNGAGLGKLTVLRITTGNIHEQFFFYL